mmetsp:Transcript_24361/g.54932  ORF Transcript_24361/g.54932 Transcript_24361/m.54932 type:complete len:238 (+) Transcript_24361:132-845(+)
MAALVAPEDDWEDWLSSSLTGLGLDTEVYKDYVEGILAEEDEPLDDRVESVAGVLGGALENPDDADGEAFTAFTGGLPERWQRKAEAAAGSGEREAKAAVEQAAAEAKARAAKDLRLAREAEAARAEALGKKKERTAEQQRLIDTFGYTADRYDEDGIPVEDSDGEDGEDAGIEGAPGGNAAAAAQYRAAQRSKLTASKAAHANEVVKGKLHKADVEKKKKEKQERARKGERKGGRG